MILSVGDLDGGGIGDAFRAQTWFTLEYLYHFQVYQIGTLNPCDPGPMTTRPTCPITTGHTHPRRCFIYCQAPSTPPLVQLAVLAAIRSIAINLSDRKSVRPTDFLGFV